jgi:hypothetical protein
LNLKNVMQWTRLPRCHGCVRLAASLILPASLACPFSKWCECSRTFQGSTAMLFQELYDSEGRVTLTAFHGGQDNSQPPNTIGFDMSHSSKIEFNPLIIAFFQSLTSWTVYRTTDVYRVSLRPVSRIAVFLHSLSRGVKCFASVPKLPDQEGR